MKLLEKILVPIDLNKSYKSLLEATIYLAKNFNSEVILIHVLPPQSEIEKFKELLVKSVKTKLLEICEQIKKEGIKNTSSILEFGSEFANIVNAAENEDVNVIIIGSGEKEKKDKFQLGITAERIIQKTEKPVWVVKKDRPFEISNILCPFDFSNPAKRSLENAIYLSRRFSTKLIVLGVYEPRYLNSLWFTGDIKKQDEVMFKDFSKEFNLALKSFNFTNVSWIKIICKGAPYKEILDSISNNKIDLLIMGSTGKTGFSKLLMGSVTEKVIREVSCSFITTKTEDLIRYTIEAEISEIESHYNIAKLLLADGFSEKAIMQFEICLKKNDMHIPSLLNLSLIYKEKGDRTKSKMYKDIALEILNRLWDKKIETEILKLYHM